MVSTVESDGLRLRRTGHVATEPWCFLLPQTFAPLDTFEERVCLDVFDGQTLGGIKDQQSFNKIFRHCREIVRETIVQCDNLLECLILVTGFEWRSTGE